ncbi:TPA: hypothetical protein QDB10_002285 [Burkholderia vietnamiensis]|nr:hypothetical protein [Burkholderia vietnamiensis]
MGGSVMRVLNALRDYLALSDRIPVLASAHAAAVELKEAYSELEFADATLLAAARKAYAEDTDDIEINDGAVVVPAPDGKWVQAWVWMPNDENACRECGEDSSGGEGYDGLCGNCADRAFGDSEG